MNPEHEDFSRAKPIIELQSTSDDIVGLAPNEDGPLFLAINGNSIWFNNGLRHKADGPAVICADDKKHWFIKGQKLTEEEFYAHPKCTAWPRLTVTASGNKHWSNKEGHWHRKDGPAIEWTTGQKEWKQNGKQHRLDGPAIENASNGCSYWAIDGKYLTEEEFYAHPKCTIKRNT